jgi:hypothetical protein
MCGVVFLGNSLPAFFVVEFFTAKIAKGIVTRAGEGNKHPK